jgi:hypothetical protein
VLGKANWCCNPATTATPPRRSVSKPPHIRASRTARDLAINVKAVAAHTAYTAFTELVPKRPIASGPSASLGDDNALPVLHEIILDDMIFVIFPLGSDRFAIRYEWVEGAFKVVIGDLEVMNSNTARQISTGNCNPHLVHVLNL